MRIESIHWGEVGDRDYRGVPGRLVALWPEPIDHDPCFEEAGFSRFADSDDVWQADFEIIINDVLAILGSHGAAVVVSEVLVQQPLLGRLLRRPAPRLALPEQIALVARDDQFAPCQAHFGSPIRAAVFASDGQPILWIWLHRDIANTLQDKLTCVARGRKLIETTLRWDVLLPESLR